MNRKPLFDVVRELLGGKLSQSQVNAIDAAITTGLAGTTGLAKASPTPRPAQPPSAPTHHRLGALSERYECGNRGPGAVSTGRNDPGGVSYGLFQLATRTGTCAAFLAAEAKKWASRFGSHAPGSDQFSAIWRAIAEADHDAFAQAQRDFIARTHYFPAVKSVTAKTGLDLNTRHPAVRDATWSTAVQHGGAVRILSAAVVGADQQVQRDQPHYDHALVEAIYAERSAYVLRVAERPNLSAGEKRLLESLVRNRFAAERADALQMLNGQMLGGKALPGAGDNKPV